MATAGIGERDGEGAGVSTNHKNDHILDKETNGETT